MNKKAAGFTLIELLFALALTGLVLVMGSHVFRVLTTFYLRYDKQAANSYDSMIFKDRLSRDFDRASFLELHQKGTRQAELLLFSLEKETLLSYQFQDSLIIRNTFIGSLDSFRLKTELALSPSGQAAHVFEKELGLHYVFQLKKQAKAQKEQPINQPSK